MLPYNPNPVANVLHLMRGWTHVGIYDAIRSAGRVPFVDNVIHEILYVRIWTQKSTKFQPATRLTFLIIISTPAVEMALLSSHGSVRDIAVTVILSWVPIAALSGIVTVSVLVRFSLGNMFSSKLSASLMFQLRSSLASNSRRRRRGQANRDSQNYPQGSSR